MPALRAALATSPGRPLRGLGEVKAARRRTAMTGDVDEALLRVIPQGGSTITGQAKELYDAQMKRVARDLDGTATYYVFDGEKIARVEQPEAGTRDFYVQEGQSIYSPLVSVHDEAASAQYWYLFDALGSTMGLVDANGNLSGKLQYDAFGNVLEEENVPRSAFFKYVGAYQYMPEAFEDMMLLWHRWYDPTVGRFVGRDALEQPGVSSPYPYASAAPCGSDDPRGTISAVAVAVGVILAWFALCGAIGAGAALVNMYVRGDKNDKHAHCIAACEIRKCGTIVQSRLWGYIKEAFDAVFGSGWSAADIKANYIGEGCAVDPRYQRVVCGTKLPSDCVACCNDLA